MADFYERLVGTSSTLDKIGIHTLRACIRENKRGNMTLGEAVTILDLPVGQQRTDAQRLITALSNATNKSEFESTLWDLMALGEVGVSAYQNETEFWARIEAL